MATVGGRCRGLWNNRRALILYEYPLNESARTMLRLERLFTRLALLVKRDGEVDHHYSLSTIFEVLEVLARSDLKSDLMRELDKHRQVLEGYRGNPSVQAQALDELIGRFAGAFEALNALSGKLGAELTANEWLMGVRGRAGIPGGAFEFDMPSYHAWLQQSPDQRRADLQRWTAGLEPVATGVKLLMGLVRESGHPVRAAAPGGQFQQNLPQGKPYQLMRLRLDPALKVVPEITGHRLMVAIRFMRHEPDGRLRPSGEDVTFEFMLCA